MGKASSFYHITGVVTAWRIWREQGRHTQATEAVEVDVQITADLGETWAVRHALWTALQEGHYEHGRWLDPPRVAELAQSDAVRMR